MEELLLEGRPYGGMTFDTQEVIRRFVMHVLPQGLHRIRCCGLRTSPTRANNIAGIRKLVAVPSIPIGAKAATTKPEASLPLFAVAACASSTFSCRGNDPSTARRHDWRISGSTPHDDNLKALVENAVRPSGRSSGDASARSLCCVHRATAAQVSTDTPADLYRHSHRSTDPRCWPQLWPARAQISIAERVAPPNIVPLAAVSSVGGFQTPAAVRVGTFVRAGVWKPSQELTIAQAHSHAGAPQMKS
jgi:hypothetical protein